MEQMFLIKYRPKTLDDLEISAELKFTIRTMIEIGYINILISGDRGCGKTTTINTILTELYGIGYNINDNILWISALNDIGMNYFRTDVKTFCQTSININCKKTVIIDDIDFMGDQCQHIIRHIIDKYNKHVHFIISCTTIHKVIDSLQSQLNVINKEPLSSSAIFKRIKYISNNEKINITDEQINQLILICNKNIGTNINYIEKLKLVGENITDELISSTCNSISFNDIGKYIDLCKDANVMEALAVMKSFTGRGYSVIDIMDIIFNYIKYTNTLPENIKFDMLHPVCSKIITFNVIHEDAIELSFFTNRLINIMTNNDK